MADSNEAPQSGGGESLAPPLPLSEATQELKPAGSNEGPQSGGGEGPAPPISLPEVTQELKPSGGGEGPAPPIPQPEAIAEAKPVEPVNAEPIAEDKIEPVLPAQTLQSAEPAQPAESVQPAQPVEPAQLVEPAQPAELAQPTQEPVTAKVVEENKLTPVEPTEKNASNVEQTQAAPQTTTTEFNWQQREAELLKKIAELEQLKNEKSAESVKLLLKVREEEIDLLKARVKNLETELHAALSKPGGKNQEMIANIKQQHEELLSKAKGMIFDKTKMVKNQELQIEALTTQVQSLKDINLITKDLLEIRNSEVKAMEERFQAMDARYKAEKERYSLVLQRAQTSSNINDDLKKEYETQLAIFKELREKYEQKVQALVAENERLKASVQGAGTSG